ncbi:MAG TPA: helix-turn-helix transcriptional regulator [Acidimicrobiales bacterium]
MVRVKAQPLRAIVGQLLRERREELGLRQDDVAEYVRAFGLTDWTRATVATLEAGKREIDLDELWPVCAGLEIGIVELLERSDAWVAVGTPVGTKTVTTSSAWPITKVREVLFSRDSRIAASMAGIREARENEVRTRDLERDAKNESVRRIARTLKTEPETVAKYAWTLWHRSLPHERDARVEQLAPPDADPRTVQALRGHVTRELRKELEQRIV